MPKNFFRKLRQRKKAREIGRVLPFLLVFGFLLLFEAGYFLIRNELRHRLPFGIRIADTEYSLVPATEAIAGLKIRAQNFSAQPFVFELSGKTVAILPSEIGLTFDIERTIGLLAPQLFNFGTSPIPVSLNEKELRNALLAKLPELEYPATDAKIFLNDSGTLEILPEQSGRQTDFSALAKTIAHQASRFAPGKILIQSTVIPPRILARELEPFRDELRKIIAEKLTLKKTEYERFEIDLSKRLTWFDFETNGELKIFLRREPIAEFVKKELNLLVAELPRDVTITRNAAGNIEFSGSAKNGRMVDTDKLFTEIPDALKNGQREITIPFQILSAPVKVSADLKELGIRELIGESVTDYAGSPANRQHNIRTAAGRLNGRLVAPGAEFSFVNNLGPVTEDNGYRKELIIKEGDIVPEIGGGVCQVSTTFFRTALNAGLPITHQQPHSIKVSYYNPPGLDATIYPGSADLDFVNDTGYYLLIQTAVEGTTLRVNFFGTSDGRNVKLAGPFYPNGDPITNLWHAGMQMFWTREVDKSDGEKIKERYDASYRYLPGH